MITEEWLKECYVERLLPVEEIAKQAGCGVANIRRYLKKWGIRRGKVFISEKVVPWNKGLTANDDERLARVAELHRGSGNPLAGREPWNKGLTASDDERLAGVSKALRGRTVSEETRAKMRAAKIGKKGERSNRWAGGATYSNGYGVHRRTVDGHRQYAHRLVAEEALGRPLLPSEHVHHIDRDKSHNERTNLLALSKDDHNRLHRAIDAGYESREQQISWLRENGIRFEELQ